MSAFTPSSEAARRALQLLLKLQIQIDRMEKKLDALQARPAPAVEPSSGAQKLP